MVSQIQVICETDYEYLKISNFNVTKPLHLLGPSEIVKKPFCEICGFLLYNTRIVVPQQLLWHWELPICQEIKISENLLIVQHGLYLINNVCLELYSVGKPYNPLFCFCGLSFNRSFLGNSLPLFICLLILLEGKLSCLVYSISQVCPSSVSEQMWFYPRTRP